MSGERGWVPAGELMAGELIRTGQGDARVESLLSLAEPPTPVFNLEVWDSHRYFVGAAGVLAHNACGAGRRPRVNKVGPDPHAAGPHTVPKRDPIGKVTGYTEFDAAGNPVKRFRGEGGPHGGLDPPLILEPKAGKGPGAVPKVPRKPTPGKLPPGY